MSFSNSARIYLRGAIEFWEPHRIGYNMALVVVTFFWFALDWTHFRRGLNIQLLVALLVLALLANITYCTAYLVDIPLQFSRFRSRWIQRRTWLWVAGVLFAILLASYWINDEIYPGTGVVAPHAAILIQNS